MFMSSPARSLAALGSKWDADWTLGGKYNQATATYEHYCACKNVQWGRFDTDIECVEDMFANNKCTSAPDSSTQFYGKNHDLGGITIDNTWRKLCECKPIGWASDFTDKQACEDAWLEEEPGCIFRSSRGLSQLGGKWDADWSLGGKYNDATKTYEHYCACKNVQWGRFDTDIECLEDMFANNKCTTRAEEATQYYGRNHDLGGITID
eukprot:Platyproteum_vivax@DN7599_c0_g1_i29.p1